MERFTILKLENNKQENYFSLCIKDTKENIGIVLPIRIY